MPSVLPAPLAAPAPAARPGAWGAVLRARLHVSSLSARWADLGLPPPPSSRALTFGTTFRVCAVCLDEYAVGDRLRVLEPCGHCFHLPCVDAWARAARRPACPVCAAPAAPPDDPSLDILAERERRRMREEEERKMLRRARVQLIDLSVHDSWLDWLAGLLKRRDPAEHPPLSLALPAD